MGISGKVTRWQEAGLISADQAAAIAGFEGSRKSGRFMKGLVGAALFAILCGVLSIIAANWMDIPAGVKIGAHGVINAAVAIFLWRTGDALRREGLTLLLFGLTLTLIILIAQVFQLGGGWANALTLWLVITAPLMVFFAQTRITAMPWMIAFLATVGFALEEYIPHRAGFYDSLIIAAIVLFLPLGLVADGNIGFFRRLKPVWAGVWRETGFVLLLAGATAASLCWYEALMPAFMRLSAEAKLPAFAFQASLAGLFAVALLAQAFYARLKNFYRDDADHKAGAFVALAATVFMSVPPVLGYEAGSVAASLHFILFWLLTGWIAQGRGWQRVVTLSILLITIRIFIIYCELFGDLLTTGFGLISGGVVMLALIWGARRINRNLKEAA